MRLEATFYSSILLCLCMCVSNGAPPKEASTGTSSSGSKYTEEEDKFIINQLSSLLEQPYNHNIWKIITETLNDKWKRKTSGFPQERSTSSIRSRFWKTLTNSKAKVKVPESLKKKVLKANLSEEGDERTARGLQILLSNNRRKSQAANNENLSTHQDGASSSRSTVPNQLMEETMEELDEQEWASDMAQELQNTKNADKKGSLWRRFTAEEDHFILDELSRLHVDYTYIQSKSLWEKIAKNHSTKCKTGTEGFVNERNAVSFRNRLRSSLVPKIQNNEITVPESLRQKLIGSKCDKNLTGSYQWYTTQEDDFIIKHLLKLSHTHIFDSSTLESIRAEHDKRREAKVPGFENARTFYSLRARLNVMKKSGILPSQFEKFSARRKGASSGESSQLTSLQIEEMVDELLNNPAYQLECGDWNEK